MVSESTASVQGAGADQCPLLPVVLCADTPHPQYSCMRHTLPARRMPYCNPPLRILRTRGSAFARRLVRDARERIEIMEMLDRLDGRDGRGLAQSRAEQSVPCSGNRGKR
jgi:hypothetical protein